jgi:hypothetical protein
MAENIYKYDLPLKNFMSRMGTQDSGSAASARFPVGTVLNQHKTIAEKRMAMLEEFFDKITVEFRLTIGENWENYFARTESNNFLKEMANKRVFTRNT